MIQGSVKPLFPGFATYDKLQAVFSGATILHDEFLSGKSDKRGNLMNKLALINIETMKQGTFLASKNTCQVLMQLFLFYRSEKIQTRQKSSKVARVCIDAFQKAKADLSQPQMTFFAYFFSTFTVSHC